MDPIPATGAYFSLCEPSLELADFMIRHFFQRLGFYILRVLSCLRIYLSQDYYPQIAPLQVINLSGLDENSGGISPALAGIERACRQDLGQLGLFCLWVTCFLCPGLRRTRFHP